MSDFDTAARPYARALFELANEEGIDVDSWGTFNSIWRLNDDGEWRVVFDAGSPAAQPPAEEVKALLDVEDDCGLQAGL